ncbi:MAG: diguanylate cyclase [Solirubrobacteraceae bacterium]
MATAPHDSAHDGEAAAARRAIARAWRTYYEDAAGALDAAVRGYESGRSLDDVGLCARARALQGAVGLHRGDLQGALELAVEAQRYLGQASDSAARCEVAALKAQVNFFSGSYADALREAELAVRVADESPDRDLRIFARRAACLVFGNVGVPDWKQRLEELLRLSVDAGDPWEEAISRNDLACYLQETGDLQGAEREIDRALAIAHSVPGPNNFALGVVHSTRADIRLLGQRPEEALQDVDAAIGRLLESGDPNPYVLGMTVRAQVQARMALGQLDDARESGEGALAWLGDRVPQMRSLILTTLATALREVGRVEEAYDALQRACELERQAFRELSQVQLSLERATLEAREARRHSELLTAKNRQLAEAHAELERRASELEMLHAQLREQAERDPLTGVHNRRYLARALERLTDERIAGRVSLAVLDVDHFKTINDRFGHAAGDEVLIRIARLLCDHLRESDSIIRSGGEEFIILMPGTADQAATAACERIRRAINTETWSNVADGLSVTTSLGVATTDHTNDLEAVMRLADQRLYEAKRNGRDRVVSELSPVEHG